MKLLAELAEQVSELGTLRRAWFTTFNLDMQFFEKHLLPVMVGAEPPRSQVDYEALQKAVVDSGLDLRIFCDQRMMGRQNKRTSVQAYGVSPLKMGFSKQSLFHPKVIYLEGEDRRAILGAGSANLTTSGWGRNQEVFAFQKVASDEQRKQIRNFFRNIFTAACDDEVPESDLTYWGEEKDWAFIHSFDHRFLSMLMSDSPEELVVWSPYFSGDLADLVTRIQEEAGGELLVRIVPDLEVEKEKAYVRTQWSSALDELVERGELSFHRSPVPMDERAECCHAKVWKTPTHLAIGSWNFTKPGANCCEYEDCNIEAGILMPDPSPITKVVGEQIADLKFATAENLEEIALDVPDVPPFDIQVRFDWREECYTIDIHWLEDCRERSFRMVLPDCDELAITGKQKTRCNSNGETIQLNVLAPKQLLTDRSFEVWEGDKLWLLGLIVEKQAEFRRSLSYASIEDIFDNLIAGIETDEESSTISLRPELGSEEEAAEDFGVAVTEREEGRSISYFRLFRATQLFADKIDGCQSLEDLERLLFVVPGCLLELSEKIRHRLTSGAGIFEWFLANEVNQLVEVARAQYGKVRPRYSAKNPPEHRWDNLRVIAPPLPGDLDPGYLAMVKEECGYGA